MMLAESDNRVLENKPWLTQQLFIPNNFVFIQRLALPELRVGTRAAAKYVQIIGLQTREIQEVWVLDEVNRVVIKTEIH